MTIRDRPQEVFFKLKYRKHERPFGCFLDRSIS